MATLKKHPRFREYPQEEGAERTIQQTGSREEVTWRKQRAECE